MHTTIRMAVLLVVLSCVVSTTPGQAETVACTAITSLPSVITVQGIYCFTGHLNTAITSGNAIDIQTNNVVLDLNGFKLGGLAAGLGTQAMGIFALNRQNITIKNGTVRGFLYGIFLAESAGTSQGHVVEDIRADQNTFAGIDMRGRGNIIRNNQVVITGGTTAFPNTDGYGIFVEGNGTRVLNNDVITVVKTGTGTSYGIVLNEVPGGMAVHNRITEADFGIVMNTPTIKYRDNVTTDVTTPFNGGTDIGNNN